MEMSTSSVTGMGGMTMSAITSAATASASPGGSGMDMGGMGMGGASACKISVSCAVRQPLTTGSLILADVVELVHR